MGHVADNLVDLAEFRARKRRAVEVAPPPAVDRALPPVGIAPFPVAVPLFAVPMYWVPVWVPVIAPTQHPHAGSGHV